VAESEFCICPRLYKQINWQVKLASEAGLGLFKAGEIINRLVEK
jgi:hypothetical protein